MSFFRIAPLLLEVYAFHICLVFLSFIVCLFQYLMLIVTNGKKRITMLFLETKQRNVFNHNMIDCKEDMR